MNLSQWFGSQLRNSAEGFVWAVEQMPSERRYAMPPVVLGTWSAARHVFHMVYYEQTIALPSMRQWLGEPPPGVVGLSEEAAWRRGPARGGPPLDGLLAAFWKVRAAQIGLLPGFDDAAWEARCVTLWGDKPLRWVVTKTYQHTAEHTHDVLSMALFWDMAG